MHHRHTTFCNNNAHQISNFDTSRHLKYNEFEKTKETVPHYRITAMPFDLDPNAISLRDEKIQQILFDPNPERDHGFGVKGFMRREIYLELDGIKGPNRGLDAGEIILQWNGYMEYKCPIFDSYFFWGKKLPQYAEFNKLDWLYPLVVCEHPVSFLRWVRELYAAANITCSFVVMQEYHNLLHLTLPAGSPDFLSLVFCLDGAHRCNSWDPIISDTKVYHPNFNTDQIAYGLLKNVYTAFGLRGSDIPFFDKNGDFSRDNGR